MLRARPIHYTSHFEQWATLLQALGLVKTVDDGDWQEFDAGSGRVALGRLERGHPLDGYTIFSVEVGNRRSSHAAPKKTAPRRSSMKPPTGPLYASLPMTASSSLLSRRSGQQMAAGPHQLMPIQHSRWQRRGSALWWRSPQTFCETSAPGHARRTTNRPRSPPRTAESFKLLTARTPPTGTLRLSTTAIWNHCWRASKLRMSRPGSPKTSSTSPTRMLWAAQRRRRLSWRSHQSRPRNTAESVTPEPRRRCQGSSAGDAVELNHERTYTRPVSRLAFG